MDTEFDLNSKELFDILHNKGISCFHHANTISTSITFLKEKHLLSRKYIEDNKLFQTRQSSDALDKIFNIWDDIFLDAIDIHKEFSKNNLYGPFLFSINLNLLKSSDIKSVRITKKNPVRWRKNENEKDWYYSDLNEFNNNYKTGNKGKDVGSMFIFKNIGGKIPLTPYLEKITLDNPNLWVNYKNENVVLSKIITDELDTILKENGFDQIAKELRHKHNFFNCKCWLKYNLLLLTNFNELKKLFHTSP